MALIMEKYKRCQISWCTIILHPHLKSILEAFSAPDGAQLTLGHLWIVTYSLPGLRKWNGSRRKWSRAVSQEVTPLALDQSRWPDTPSGQRDWSDANGVTSCDTARSTSVSFPWATKRIRHKPEVPANELGTTWCRECSWPIILSYIKFKGYRKVLQMHIDSV